MFFTTEYYMMVNMKWCVINYLHTIHIYTIMRHFHTTEPENQKRKFMSRSYDSAQG